MNGIVELAKSVARTSREGGGHTRPKKPKAPALFKPKTIVHAGPIHSSVAGRTDHLPMHVPSGSYVIPADIVSGMGEGNTAAGFKHLKRMFSGTPRGQGEHPYGQAGGPYGSGQGVYGQGKGPYGMKDGGSASSVPIVAAGGEHVLTPDEVREAGGGDLDTGHKVLDAFVLRMRKELIHTLKHLAPPKKD
jgi:hypothetical protein